jgi:ligand-binding sensor domain-containing protein
MLGKRGHAFAASAALIILAEITFATFVAEANPVRDIQEEYIHRSWSRSDGLPDNQVNDIQQTADGYLWLATPLGLARFDGRRFVVFDQKNTPQLRDIVCLALAEDRSATLWVATEGGLLARTMQGFRAWPAQLDRSWSHPLVPAQSGGVWTAYASTPTLFHIATAGSAKPEPLPVPFNPPISAIYEHPDGRLWIGDAQGAYWVDRERKQAIRITGFPAEEAPSDGCG